MLYKADKAECNILSFVSVAYQRASRAVSQAGRSLEASVSKSKVPKSCLLSSRWPVSWQLSPAPFSPAHQHNIASALECMRPWYFALLLIVLHKADNSTVLFSSWWRWFTSFSETFYRQMRKKNKHEVLGKILLCIKTSLESFRHLFCQSITTCQSIKFLYNFSNCVLQAY